MEVFPIIYTRTYYMDYAPDFYICPNLPIDTEIEKYRKSILESLKCSNLLRDIRRLIVSENEYSVVGIVCHLFDFVLQKQGETNDKYLKFTKDSKDRKIVSFIGILVKNSELPEGMIIKDFDDVMFSLFENYIANDERWFDKNRNHYLGEKYDVEIEKLDKKKPPEGLLKCYGKIIYPSNWDNDIYIFQQIMSKYIGSEKRVRFCSDYYGIESVKISEFNRLTSQYMDKIELFYKNSVDDDREMEKRKRHKSLIKSKKKFLFI